MNVSGSSKVYFTESLQIFYELYILYTNMMRIDETRFLNLIGVKMEIL